MRVSPAVGTALASIILAACGGGSSKQSASSTTSTSRSRSVPAAGTSPSCHLVTSADLRGVGANTPSKVEQLANGLGQHRRCSDVFLDASGGLILEITEDPGGPPELAAARKTARGQSPRARSRPLPGIAGGFIVGQQLGFLNRGQVVALSTGYTTNGQPELTTAQLIRLAGVVAHG